MAKVGYKGGPPHGQSGPKTKLTDNQIASILKGDGETIADAANLVAEAISGVSKARIRNFYGPVVQLQAALRPETLRQTISQLHLMRPRLVYLGERVKSDGGYGDAGALLESFESLLGGLGQSEDQQRSVRGIFEFCEALVAYHYKYAKR